MGALQKVFFVDCTQQLGTGQLHELVFQRRDAQRSRLSVLLGDVDAPDQLRPVAPRFHSLRQLGDVALQVGGVDLCRQPVDAAGRVLVQVLPAIHQQFGVYLPEEVAKAVVFALFRSIGYCPQ